MCFLFWLLKSRICRVQRLLAELRSVTLQVVESLLEYTARLQPPGTTSNDELVLPRVKTKKFPKNDMDTMAILAEMITDSDPVFALPAVRRILPAEFPCSRNPFILAKDVDGISSMAMAAPAPGDVEQV